MLVSDDPILDPGTSSCSTRRDDAAAPDHPSSENTCSPCPSLSGSALAGVGRERPVRHRTQLIELPVARAATKKPTWCVFCERPIGPKFDQHLTIAGAVICHGSCKRSFHIQCLTDRGDSPPLEDPFTCQNCISSKVICIICSKPITADATRRPCEMKACRAVFHEQCWTWSDKICQRHRCFKCSSHDVYTSFNKYFPRYKSKTVKEKDELYHCIRCSIAYHVGCIPKTAIRLEMHTDAFFICSHHNILPTSIVKEMASVVTFDIPRVHTFSIRPFSLPPGWFKADGAVAKPNAAVMIWPWSQFDPSDPKITDKRKCKNDSSQLESKPRNSQTKEQSVAAFSLTRPKDFVMAPFKTCSRNIYVDGKPPPTTTSAQDAHICDCVGDMNCTEALCVNRAMQIECDPRFCPCGDQCQNQRLQKRQYQPMRLVYTTNRGCGMIAAQRIPAGALVIEYIGEVINQDTLCKRMIASALDREENYYMFQLSKKWTIDAKRMGNESRFINHSCDPNCRTEIWTIASGQLRAGIFAIRDIAGGEEVTYDYQFELFATSGRSHRTRCRCGSKNCCKFLGAPKVKVPPGKNRIHS